MTLNEALGVNDFSIDVKTGGEISLEEYCQRAIDFLGGLDEVGKYIPFPIETIREKLKNDPHLNNLSLSAWDTAAGYVCGTFGNAWRQEYSCRPTGGGLWRLYVKHGVTSVSCADGVCILKEAARLLAA
jgi:hypothetical protein